MIYNNKLPRDTLILSEPTHSTKLNLSSLTDVGHSTPPLMLRTGHLVATLKPFLKLETQKKINNSHG